MQLATWYTIDNPISTQQATTYINAVVALFIETLNAMWNMPILRIFLAFALLAAIFALCLYFVKAARSGKK
jgi:hypothetical protein